MTILTATERGDMVERLIPVATNLAMLVHGDGGPRDIHQALVRLTPGDKDALLVILAALVDPDQPIGKALGWVEFDEYGELTVPEWGDDRSLRSLREDMDTADVGGGDVVDEVAVERYASGERVMVSPAERLEAVARAVRRGRSYLDIDAQQGLRLGDTSTFVSRARKAYARDGMPFPDMTRPDASRTFSKEEVTAIRERSAAGATDMEISLTYGVDQKAIGNICRGDRYPQYGGPIRQPRNKPGAATRVVWARGDASFAKNSVA